MRIISNQKDYYDFVVQYGSDPKIVYNRKFVGKYEPFKINIGEELKDSDHKIEKIISDLYSRQYRSLNYNLARWNLHHLDEFYKHVILGVNGYLYGLVLYHNYKRHETHCHYSLIELPVELGKSLRERTFALGTPNQAMQVVECLEPFVYWNTPCFIWTEKEIFNTPKLADVGFNRYLDPYRQFQETQWFIGNELNTRNTEQPEDVADKYRIEQHGFNKLSFRHPVK